MVTGVTAFCECMLEAGRGGGGGGVKCRSGQSSPACSGSTGQLPLHEVHEAAVAGHRRYSIACIMHDAWKGGAPPHVCGLQSRKGLNAGFGGPGARPLLIPRLLLILQLVLQLYDCQSRCRMSSSIGCCTWSKLVNHSAPVVHCSLHSSTQIRHYARVQIVLTRLGERA